MSNEVNPSTDGVEEAVAELAEESQVVEEVAVAEKAVEEEVVEEVVEEEPKDENYNPVEDTEVMNPLMFDLASNDWELTDELIERAKEAGISKDSLELAGIKDKERVTTAKAEIFEVAGGEDNFRAIQEWANVEGNMTKAEQDEFNEGVAGSNRLMFVRGLKYMYDEANPKATEPVVQEERSKGNPTQEQPRAKGFKSLLEMQNHIRYMRKNPSDADAQRTYETKMKYSGALLQR